MKRYLKMSQIVMAAIMCLGSVATAHAQSVWREAFQSSPATYEAPNAKLLQSASAQIKAPVEVVKRLFSPSPVEGTIRYRITITGSGDQVRLRLSNEEGRSPLILAGVSVGQADDKFAARPATLRRVTFGGAAGITIPAGAPGVSDPVDFPVTSGMELIVSVALGSPFMNEARGGSGFETAAGDQVMNAALGGARIANGRPLVSAVEVRSDPSMHVIVALGDSITDGNREAPGTLHSWPQQFARRIRSDKTGRPFTVANAGIGGNRMLASGWGASALARLDRDALRIDGITHLILLEGLNDIGMSGVSLFGDTPAITAPQLIAAYRQVIARAHARGVKVLLGTLTPAAGSASHSSPQKDATRAAVNAWIRTAKEADGVIDFDAMLRDPGAPDHLLAAYDSGDHLHPNDAGYKAMGDGIDLSLFR
jgi:lysophospholipase L1-like esterase